MKHASTLKQELAALGAATEVGLASNPQSAAAIAALAAELEAMNPTEEPARAAALLRGRWRLIYSDLDLLRETTLAKLSFGIAPPSAVHVVELFHEVDPSVGLWDMVVTFEDSETGLPGTLTMPGDYQVVDDAEIDIRFDAAIVSTAAAPVRLPIGHDQLPTMHNHITFMDEGFRMVRGNAGNLYIFERLDAAPMRWSRDI